MSSLTATGRRLEVLESVLLPLARKAILHPAAGDLARQWRSLLAALAVAIWALRRRWRSWAEARSTKRLTLAAESAPDVDEQGSGDSGSKSRVAAKAKLNFVELLCGERGSVPAGLLKEIVCTVMTAVADSLMVVQKVKTLEMLTFAMGKGDRGFFLRALLRYPVLVVGMALVKEAFNFFKRRLALEWRRVLTYRLHGMYFSNMAYYRLLNADQPGMVISDADARIAKDVPTMCEAYSNLAVSLTTSVITTVMYGFRGRQPGRDWKWMLVGPAWPIIQETARGVLHELMRRAGDWAQTRAGAASSRYEQALTRIQMHADSICMLQGEQFEHDVLQKRAASSRHWSLQVAGSLMGDDFARGLLYGSASVGAFSFTCYTCAAIVCANRLGQVGGTLSPDAASLLSAKAYGEWIADAWYFLSIMVQWGGFFQSLMSIEEVKGSSSRVVDLFTRLREIEAEASAQPAGSGTFADEGALIAFRDVTVQTPTQQELVKHLSFEVGVGRTLLVSGHNGAGKSSIMRCLCNIWSIPCGAIVRPGGAVHAEQDASLHKQIYYLPQKPVNVLGSLSDQLTYPLQLQEGLHESELRLWLSYVDLEYLVDRHFKSDATSGQGYCDWDELLSLGEQQALSLARLLYHRPRFAVLDECTSAIPRYLERRLFEVSRVLGITYLTIAHRPILKEQHGQSLFLTGSLGVDGCGWGLEDLPNRKMLEEQTQPWCSDTAEAHSRIAKHISAERANMVGGSAALRSPSFARAMTASATSTTAGKPADNLALKVGQRWPNSIKRALAFLAMGLRGAEPAQRRQIYVRLGCVLSSTCLQTYLGWQIWVSVGSMLRSALIRSYAGIAAEGLSAFFLVLVAGRIQAQLQLWRRTVIADLTFNGTSSLHRLALNDGAFLRIMRPHVASVLHVESPVQRIGEVKDLFNDVLVLCFDSLSSFVSGLWMLPSLVGGGGPWPIVILAAHSLFNLWTIRFAPDWRSFIKTASTLHTRFQVLHTRLRHIAEPVAFSGGGGAERRVIESQFNALHEHKQQILQKEFVYNWTTSIVKGYDMIPIAVMRGLLYNFSRHNNPAFGQPELGASPNTMIAAMLYERVIMYAQGFCSQAVTVADTWPQLDGRIQRILELVTALEAVKREEDTAKPSAAVAQQRATGEAIVVKGLDLVTPRGACLGRGVTFELREGNPVLVTGPNASGKSLLGGVLLGILPTAGEAQIMFPGSVLSMPARPPLSLLMTAPQRIYLPIGTLGDQVCYPERHASSSLSPSGDQEERMVRALRAAGIEHLLTRELKGWGARNVWEDVLSGGEQQRMGLARVFFHQPRFALLDECTSMVAASAENGLYQTLVKEFGITPLTLTQRLFLEDLHKLELKLGAATSEGWALEDTVSRGPQTRQMKKK